VLRFLVAVFSAKMGKTAENSVRGILASSAGGGNIRRKQSEKGENKKPKIEFPKIINRLKKK
jgi:hypothetical protein